MKIKLLIVMLVSFVNSLFAQEANMNTQEIADFKTKIIKEAKSITSLTTGFVQYKHLEFLSNDVESSGKMIFLAPDNLLWEYSKPYKYSIIFQNNKVNINNQGNKSTIDAKNNKLFEKINKLIIGSVSGNMFDETEFMIQYAKNKTHNIAKFTPKSKDILKLIKKVELYFPLNDNTVAEVKLIETSGDYTKIVFKNKVLNAKVDKSDFTF